MRILGSSSRFLWGAVAIPVILSVPIGSPDGRTSVLGPRQAGSPSSFQHLADYGKFPLQFVPNKGQTDQRVGYYVQGRDKTIYFTKEGLTFVLMKDHEGTSGADSVQRWVIKLDFADASKSVRPTGLEESGTVISQFKGSPDRWRAGMRACSRIVYRDLWPGIDLVYSGTFDRMKYEFTVRPGADPSSIGLVYRGAKGLILDRAGRLHVQTPGGGFEDEPPVAFQVIDGARVPVPAAFRLEEGAEESARGYGFRVGEYDRSRPLVLDPSSLVYCGFIGGSWLDDGHAIAVDAAGSAYVTGSAELLDETFPVTVGPDLTYNSGYGDAFVAKVNPSGTGLEYCGFIGGSGDDTATGIAVDAAGNAYITGYTNSPAPTFPLLVGPGLERKEFVDAFVAKIDPGGTALLFCGYIGGALDDYALAIAVDGTGSAYVAGSTASSQASFPAAVGPSTVFKGSSDAFVAKVIPSGASLAYCGYIGGTGDDIARGIAVDGQGNAYLTGDSAPGLDEWGDALPPDFPTVVGPDLSFNGAMDAFAAKVDPTGSILVYSGYIGGTSGESGLGIAVDSDGNAYISGTTSSPDSSFPVTVGPDLTHNGTAYPGNADAFVAKVNPSGAALVYCGYIGGAGRDDGPAIAVDAAGCAYVTGTTESRADTFPVSVGPALVSKDTTSTTDIYVAKVSASGDGFEYCGYISGVRGDEGKAIAVDDSGHAYITGRTYSTDGYWGFFPTIVGPDLTFNGGDDVFVAKIEAVPAVSSPELHVLTPAEANAGDQGLTIDISGADFIEGAQVFWDGRYMPTTFLDPSALRTEVSSDVLTSGRIAQVIVRNPDGQTTNALPVSVYNPVPSLSSLSPAYLTGGSGSSWVMARGANFVPTSTVRWDGVPGESSYVVSGWIDTAVPADLFVAGGEFQVTVENPAPAGGMSNALAFRVSTFTLSPSQTSVTVNAGEAATYTILLKPQFASFDGTVTFTCQGLPKDCTGSFFPGSTMPGTNWLETVLTLKTKARTGAAVGSAIGSAAGPADPFLAALSLAFLAGAFFAGSRSRRLAPRSPSRSRLAVCALVLVAVALAGCGAGGGGDDHTAGGTPAGSYSITVLGTSGTLTISTAVTLVVR